MPEDLNLGEHPKPRVDYLVQELGFIETPEMAAVRQLATEAMASGREHSRELSTEYLRAGEQLVDQQEPENKNRARIGLNITRALMYRDSGRTDDYVECMYDIIDDLYNLVAAGFNEFASVIDALKTEIQFAIVEE